MEAFRAPRSRVPALTFLCSVCTKGLPQADGIVPTVDGGGDMHSKRLPDPVVDLALSTVESNCRRGESGYIVHNGCEDVLQHPEQEGLPSILVWCSRM